MLAFCLLLAQAPAFDRGVGEVRDVLERHAEGTVGDTLERELESLGPAALEDLFAVLAGRANLERELRPDEREALTGALASFGPTRLRAFAEPRFPGRLRVEERVALLAVLARNGTRNELDLARRCVESPATAGLETPLERALAPLVARDPRALGDVQRWILQAPTDLATSLVRAVGASERQEGLPILCALLDAHTALARALLAEIGRLAEHAPQPIAREVLAPVRRMLESDDPQVLREAALALGRAEDALAAEELVHLLAHEHEGARTAAAWALERMTGLRLRGDPVRWSVWLAAEQRWFREEGRGLADALAERRSEVAVRALGVLSQHRLRRHELALVTVGGLVHPEPNVRLLACTVLQRLASPTAVPALQLALFDEDPAVARAARQTLAALGVAVPAAASEPVADAGSAKVPASSSAASHRPRSAP